MGAIKKQRLSQKFYIDDFSGGMVTNVFDDKLKPNEFTVIKNADYTVRGGLIKRFGYSNIVPDNQSLLDLGISQPDIDDWFTPANFVGIQQSMTKIFAKVYTLKVDGTMVNPAVTDDDYEIIINAIDGNLVITNYIAPTGGNKLTDIDGFPTIHPSRIAYSGFQNVKVFKTGQGLGNNLIATPGDALLLGKLVFNEASGTTEFLVETLNSIKKIPSLTEYSVLGGNILALDPFDDVTDELMAQSFKAVNLRTRPEIGFIDQETELTAYFTIPGVLSDFEFQWSVKKPGESTYTIFNTWQTGAGGKSVEYTPKTILKEDGSASDETIEYANFAFKVEAREVAVPENAVELEITTYRVTAVDSNIKKNVNQIDVNKCLNFEVSDDRIKFYNNGSPLWYKSAIDDETYILTNGVLNFDTIKTENVTAVLSYRNGKLVFTPTTCHIVRGFGDDIPDINGNFSPYISEPISTNLGCIATGSLAVADDIVFFLSENGLYALDTLAVDQNRAELVKVSDPIDNIVYRDTNAVGVVYNNKYYLFYPDRKQAIKLDFIYGRKIFGVKIPDKPFSVDQSEFIDFHYVTIIDNSLVGLSKANGTIMQQNKIVIDSDVALNRLEDIVFEDGFFTDDGNTYLEGISSKRYNNVDLTSGLNQSSIDKRVKLVFVNVQQYSKEPIKFFLELFSEFGKIINVTTLENTIEVIGEERQVVVNVVKTYNVVTELGFQLNQPGASTLGSSELGFFDSVVSFVRLMDSKISKSFKFVFTNDLDQPAVITGFGADMILYRRPRDN